MLAVCPYPLQYLRKTHYIAINFVEGHRMITSRLFTFAFFFPFVLFAQNRGMKTPDQAMQSEKRIALVIGNGAY